MLTDCFNSLIKEKSASQAYNCFNVLQCTVIKSTKWETSLKKINCSGLSSSVNHALDFTEKLKSEDWWIFYDNDCIIFNVSGLCFNISLPHQDFITVFEGHQVFNSIPENKSL